MQTIRRLYLYAVSFVSLQVVVWGVIGLARSLASGGQIGGQASLLAGGLALVLVGLPVFALHWWLAQRAARQDEDERSSRLRAVFLYGALAAALVPVAQNGLALLDRLLLQGFGANPLMAMWGGGQSAADNLIAMLVNALAALFLWRALRADLHAHLSGADVLGADVLGAGLPGAAVPGAAVPGAAFAETRRLFHLFWLFYTLLLVVFGVLQLVRLLLSGWGAMGGLEQASLAHGLALLLVGAPLWAWIDTRWQAGLDQPGERGSALRLAALYVLTLGALFYLLFAAGQVLYALLLVAFGERPALPQFLSEQAGSLGVLLCGAVVWRYYGRRLWPAMIPNTSGDSLEARLRRWGQPYLPQRLRRFVPRRAAPPGRPGEPGQSSPVERSLHLRRVYATILALPALAGVFAGLQLLLEFLVDQAVPIAGVDAFRSETLATILAALAVALPVWLWNWIPLQREASGDDERGDLARRSLLRRGYLYLVLFSTILGIMASAGLLLFELLRAALGAASGDLAHTVLNQAMRLALFAVFFTYHAWALRQDNRLAGRMLARRQAQFPVLILAPTPPGRAPRPAPPQDGEGEEALPRQAEMDAAYVSALTGALQRQSPGVPVAVAAIADGVPGENLSAARAVILPAELVANPSEAYRIWLQNFGGEKLVLFTPAQGWRWLGGPGDLPDQARQAAHTIRLLAEGQPVEPAGQRHALTVVAYIFAGLFTLQLLLLLASLGVSLFLR